MESWVQDVLLLFHTNCTYWGEQKFSPCSHFHSRTTRPSPSLVAAPDPGVDRAAANLQVASRSGPSSPAPADDPLSCQPPHLPFLFPLSFSRLTFLLSLLLNISLSLASSARRGAGRRLAGVGRRRPVTLSRPLPDLPLLSSPLPFLSLSSSYLSLLGFVRDDGTGVCTACGTRGLGCVRCGRGAWMGQILSHPGAAYPANTDTRRAHQSLGRKMNRGVKII